MALPAAAASPQLVSSGQALLTEKCASCHAVGRTGDSPHAAAPPFRFLQRRFPLDDLAEAMAEGLQTGHPDMPEFVFSPRQIDAALAYLKSIQVK
jgi:mono/diheme cytochrome c family protein